MQTNRRILQSVGANLPQGTFPHGCLKGNKRIQKDEAGGRRPKNDFLKKVFRPLPATRFYPLFNSTNYDFLYLSARNYLKLSGSSFDFLPHKKDFSGLFEYFQNLLPEGQYLSLTEENRKLLFRVSFGDDFLKGEVFFIPIIILNRTEGVFRDILLTFFQHFQQAYHLPRKETMYDHEVIVDCFFDEWYEHDDDSELRDFLEAYRKGYINDTFSLIHQKPNRSIRELEKQVKNYTPKTGEEKRLIAFIRQGINILLMNKNIFKYVRRPRKDECNFDIDDEDFFIEADRLIRFVYSGNDYVTESYLETINTEITDGVSEYFPRNSIILTPETDRLLEVDFVECFFSWLARFINELYDYEKRRIE